MVQRHRRSDPCHEPDELVIRGQWISNILIEEFVDNGLAARVIARLLLPFPGTEEAPSVGEFLAARGTD